MCLYQMLEDLQVTTMWFEVTIYTMYCIFFFIWSMFNIRLNARALKKIFPLLKAKSMIYNEALQYIEFLRALYNFLNIFSM